MKYNLMLKRSKFALIATAVMGLVVVASASPTLLLNGDFASPVQPPNTFIPVGNSILGWTVVGTGNVDQVSAGTTYWPGNSSQFMDLTGNTGGAGIRSDAFSTVLGQIYQISFDAFNGSLVYPGTPYTGPVLSVQASGDLIANYNGSANLPPGVSVALTYSFTAVSTSTTLTFMDTSGVDSNAGWIDNVAIQAVPEPSPMTLLAGFLVVSLGMKKLLALRPKQNRGT